VLRLWLPLACVPPGAKDALLRIGLSTTRHPRMGAVEQPWVAVREPSWNQAAKRKTSSARLLYRNLKLLLGNHHKTKAIGIRGRNTLRSVVRQGSALRSDRWRGSLWSALTDACAAGVASHEEHVCSSVLKENRSATAAAGLWQHRRGQRRRVAPGAG
jgi:hypothetical protein